jgi:type III restriction enzyme
MRLSLSEHTLDINVHRCDVGQFDFSEVEEYVLALTGDRDYQYKAIKDILIYLWGGAYASLAELAKENYRRKPAIQQRFHSEEHFLRMLPLPDRISGVCHQATGTGKSYVMFAIAHLSILLGKVRRVLILGPSSTVIESGLREKFKEYLYGEKGTELKLKLPDRLRNKVIRLLNCNDPIEDSSIVIENINAIYNRDRNSIGDTLFNHGSEVLVLSDEVHHAYSHLTFTGEAAEYDFEAGSEGGGDVRDERLWMKFIREEAMIRRHIGFTGTPYNRDDYFPDVIANYSIKDAIDEKIIKRINPILKTETDEGDADLTLKQRFEQILATHAENKTKFSYRNHSGRQKVKPITIFIHPTQAAAEKNSDEFVKVLADDMRARDRSLEGMARSALEQAAREKVIVVISRLGEGEYRQKLDQIEETDSDKVGGKVEFIFAVNKLSEGWDVDNVFQIVPSEERVFNSKLLISQVLGRGLRLPRKVNVADIQFNYPVVTITNHEKFAHHIMELLDEVTECELRLSSNVLAQPDQKRYSHNFNLFNLEYLPSTRVEPRTGDEGAEEGGHRELLLAPSADKLGVRVTYLQGVKRFELSKDFFTVDQVVLDIERRFKNTAFETHHFDFGDGMVLNNTPTAEDIEIVIRAAMNKAGIEGDLLSRENRQAIEIHFNQFLPRGKKKVIRENIEGAIKCVATTSIQQVSARAGGLEHELSVFLSEDFEAELTEDNRFVLHEITNADGQQSFGTTWLQSQEGFNRDYIRQLAPFKRLYAVNPSLFRTPQDLVIASHEPERLFLFQLIENSKFVSSWVKSPDREFYSLDYEYWKGGKDRVRRSFNPDFFIRTKLTDYLDQFSVHHMPATVDRLRHFQDQGVEELVFVIEVKSDDDNSDETRAKTRYGEEHFSALNRRLRVTNPIDLPVPFRSSLSQLYGFWVLRPVRFSSWFGHLRTGTIAFELSLPHVMPEERVDADHWAAIQSRVVEDWGADSLQSKLCAAIVSELGKPPRRFRLSELPELVGRQAPDRDVDLAAMYLASPRVRLLRLTFELIDEDGESHSVSPPALVRGIQEDALEHPVTNEIVEGFREKIVMYLEDAST